jgi:transcriptional regulator with XRE-family HTH domain
MDLAKLGRRVQGLRAERGMTLQELADASGVSVSMLSSVERGTKAPTVVVLDRVAHGLGAQLATLVAEPKDQRVVVRRAADQDVADEPGGWRRTILTPVVPGVNFEWVSVTLPVGCDAGTYLAYAPGSHEFVVVADGVLALTVGDRRYLLEAGDSLYLAADVDHGFANAGGTPCAYSVAALIMRPRNAGARR